MPIANQTFGSQTTDMTKPVGLMTPTKDAPVVNQRSAARAGNYTIRPSDRPYTVAVDQTTGQSTGVIDGRGARAPRGDGPMQPDRMPSSQPARMQPRPVMPNQNPAVTQPVGLMTPAAGQTSNPATVAGQLTDLLNSDSPYMQAARDYSNQVMNARGLTQSSIAVSAAQEAAIRAGLPIAQQDASQSYTTGRDATLNQYDLAKTDKLAAISADAAAQAQEYDIAKMGVAQDYNLANLSAQTEAQKALAAQGQEFDMAKINANLAAQTALSESQNAQLVANNAQSQYNSAVYSLNQDYGASFRAIQEGTMTDAQKQAALAALDAKYTSDMSFNYALYSGLGAGTIDPSPFVAETKEATAAAVTDAIPAEPPKYVSSLAKNVDSVNPAWTTWNNTYNT